MQAGNEWSNIFPKSFEVRKKPPPPHVRLNRGRQQGEQWSGGRILFKRTAFYTVTIHFTGDVNGEIPSGAWTASHLRGLPCRSFCCVYTTCYFGGGGGGGFEILLKSCGQDFNTGPTCCHFSVFRRGLTPGYPVFQKEWWFYQRGPTCCHFSVFWRDLTPGCAVLQKEWVGRYQWSVACVDRPTLHRTSLWHLVSLNTRLYVSEGMDREISVECDVCGQNHITQD